MEFEVDPRKVLYSQDSIRARFRNDELIEDTIEKLVTGEISPEQIKFIRVYVISDNKMHSLDNRRLYAFKEAIKRGGRFRTVTAIRSHDYGELQSKMSKSPAFNDWSEIRVRGKPRTQYKPKLHVNSSSSIYVNSVPKRVNSSRTSSVSTRTQTIPNLYVNNSRTSSVLSTRTQNIPSLYMDSLDGLNTRTQDSYVSRLHTRTQDSYMGRTHDSFLGRTQDSYMGRTQDSYMGSLHTRTQDSYMGSLHTTRTQNSIYVNSLPTRKSIFMDDDVHTSMPKTPKKDKKGSWCVIA